MGKELVSLLCVALLAGFAGAQSSRESVPADADERLDRLGAELSDGDASVRLRAVSALARLDGDGAAAALATIVLSDADPAVREEAVHGSNDLSVLEQALLDPEPGVRRAAVERIGGLGGDDRARAVAPALGDEDAAVREEAVHALAEIRGQIAVDLLHLALADERGTVREAAAEALAEVASRRP